MDILLSLLLLLVVARALGELAERAKLPALAGEIFAGILLGPSLLGLVSADAGITLLADVGIFFVVYLAALELTLEDVKRSIRESGIYIAIGAFTLPLLGGTALGGALGYPPSTAMFLGIALAFTALPVAVRILSDLNILNTHFGRSLVAAGLLCDVAGLAMIGILLNVQNPAAADPFGTVLLILKFATFAMLMVSVDAIFRFRHSALGSWILRHAQHFTTRGAAFALPFLVALGFALAADLLGLHFVVGAFFGTLLVAEHVIGEGEVKKVREATAAVTWGFLGPVFFAFIGLTFVVTSLTDAVLVGSVLTVAVVTKFVGGYIGAYWSKLPRRYRYAAGIGMNGRGAMELVVASLGLQLGFIDAGLFSILVFTGVATTLMTPLGLRYILRGAQPAELSVEAPRAVRRTGGLNGGG